MPTLRRVFTARVLVLALLQVGLVVVLGRWQLVPQLERLQIDLNGTLAQYVAATTVQSLQQPVAALTANARLLNDTSISNARLYRGVTRMLVESHDVADSVFVLDAQGQVRDIAQTAELAAQGGNRSGLDFSSSELFVVGRRATTAVSPIYLSPVSEKPTVAVSTQLAHGGLLVMELNLERLVHLEGEAPAQTGLNVLLVDANGYIVADRNAGASQRNAMLPIDALRAVRTNGLGVPIEYNGRSWLATSSSVEFAQLEWRVLVLRSMDSLYAPIGRIVLVTLFSIATLMLASYAVLLLFARGLTRATELLSRHAQDYARGNEPDAANLRFRDLADVDHSMRSMAQTLRQGEQALREANEVLEQRVQERTAHLQQSNEELAGAMRRLAATQDELVQAGKMSALGSMVAGIAHEMNTPVGNARLIASTIKDAAGRMERDLQSGTVSRSQLQSCVETVSSGADLLDRSLERAADLVMSFKQVAVDQTSNRRRTFCLQDVVHENEVLLAPRLRRASASVEVHAPAEKILLDSYPGALGQVLTNLIENALFHGYGGDPGGKIDVIIDPLPDDRVRLQIRDYGRGIAPEAIGRVFDPFFTTRLGQGGSGLGLSIVFGLVTRALGGRITVDSVQGQGATFTLVLPLQGPQTAEEGSAHSVAPPKAEGA